MHGEWRQWANLEAKTDWLVWRWKTLSVSGNECQSCIWIILWILEIIWRCGFDVSFPNISLVFSDVISTGRKHKFTLSIFHTQYLQLFVMITMTTEISNC